MTEQEVSQTLRELFPDDYPGSIEQKHLDDYYEQMAINTEPRWSNYGGWIN